MMRKFVMAGMLALPFALASGLAHAHGDDAGHNDTSHDAGHHDHGANTHEHHDHGSGDHAGHTGSDDGHHAKHGGQFQETEGHHGVEMVTTNDALVFHVLEDHKPKDLTGGSFKAVVQSKSGTQMLALKADGSKLSGVLDAALPKGAKVVLTGKDKSGHTIQARFVKE